MSSPSDRTSTRSPLGYVYVMVGVMVFVAGAAIAALVLRHLQVERLERIASDYHLATELEASRLEAELDRLERELLKPGLESGWASRLAGSTFLLQEHYRTIEQKQQQFGTRSFEGATRRLKRAIDRLADRFAAQSREGRQTLLLRDGSIDQVRIRSTQLRALHAAHFYEVKARQRELNAPGGFVALMAVLSFAGTVLVVLLLLLTRRAIRHRERAEAELQRSHDAARSSEEELAAAQAIAHIGSWQLDLKSGKLSTSAELRRMLGASPDDSAMQIEELIDLYVHPEDRDAVASNYASTLETGKDISYEFRLVRAGDGHVTLVWSETDVTFDEHGRPVILAGTLQDITDQRKAERQLRESEERLRKMESQLAHVSRLSTMGELVAGIAHEVNQPLSAIANFAQACRNAVRDPEQREKAPIEDWLQAVADEAVRCGDIIRGLRKFVEKGETSRQPLVVNQVVRDSIALIDHDPAASPVWIDCELPERGPVVQANEIQTQQVFVNLLRNACEAAAGAPSPHVEVRVEAHDGFAVVTIEDNGPGLDDSQLRLVFDAFHTSKPDGMGMGLAISKSIVEAHGGTIAFDPSFRDGARVRVRLPLAGLDSPAEASRAESTAPAESS